MDVAKCHGVTFLELIALVDRWLCGANDNYSSSSSSYFTPHTPLSHVTFSPSRLPHFSLLIFFPPPPHATTFSSFHLHRYPSQDAAKREVLEETGMEADITTLLMVESAGGSWFRFVVTGNVLGGYKKLQMFTKVTQTTTYSLTGLYLSNIAHSLK